MLADRCWHWSAYVAHVFGIEGMAAQQIEVCIAFMSSLPLPVIQCNAADPPSVPSAADHDWLRLYAK